MGDDFTIYVLVGVALLAGVFYLARLYVWWYFGIDRALAHLASIDESLKQLPVVKRHDFAARSRGRGAA